MSSNRFQGKTVLVTGATTGIGRAAAEAFAAEGARVVATARNAQDLAELQAKLGAGTIAVPSDAADPAAARELAARLAAEGVQLDAVFLNAGMARFASLSDADEALWDQMFATNVKGPFF